MCGLAGIMMRDGGAPDAGVLDRLRAALAIRGPDSHGVYVDHATGLVETRLAIVDVANGQQPLYGHAGAVLVANGEIYNAPELREAWIGETRANPFKTLSDCEPAVHLFERLGPAYADRLRGMYAIALYDPERRRLTLSRDAYGIKPLYYVETDGAFAFASEPQALFAAGLATADAIAAKARELLQLKHVTGSATIFRGVNRVQPGETLVIEDGVVVDRRRINPLDAGRSLATDFPPLRSGGGEPPAGGWRGLAGRFRSVKLEPPSPSSARSPPPASQGEIDRAAPTLSGRHVSLETALKGFERVMTDSVAVHLRTDVPYGLFFSGGVDSSILLTLMQRLAGARVKALTLGYGGSGGARVAGDESWDALEIAAGAGAACRRVEMTAQDFWTLAPRIAAALDDPTTDAAILPTYMLGRAARDEGLKVTLCGEGADELFGGYSRYRRARVNLLGVPLSRLAQNKTRRGVFDDVPGLKARLAGWPTGLDAVEAQQRPRWRSRLRLLQAIDVVERLPNSLLVKLDRCLMASSVEGRTPFLDREVVDFSLTLPDKLLANVKHGKVLLREWLARANPAARPFARKQGFNPPVGAWMAARADELGTLVSVQPAIAELADAQTVRDVFDAAERHHQPAWSLLFYALWHSHHVLGVPCDGDVAEVLHATAR